MALNDLSSPSKAKSSMIMALLGIEIIFSDLQPTNAPFSIIMTLSGISMAFSEAQPKKVLSPILVTPSGIIIEVKPLSPQQRQAVIDFTSLLNVKFFILLKLKKGG
jgi:hypothetical protein